RLSAGPSAKVNEAKETSKTEVNNRACIAQVFDRRRGEFQEESRAVGGSADSLSARTPILESDIRGQVFFLSSSRKTTFTPPSLDLSKLSNKVGDWDAEAPVSGLLSVSGSNADRNAPCT